MLESIRILTVSVKSLDAPSLIQQFAFQLHSFVTQAHRFVERAILFQWVLQSAMTTVIGHVAAARMINIILFLLQYRFGRIALTFLIWLLRILV